MRTTPGARTNRPLRTRCRAGLAAASPRRPRAVPSNAASAAFRLPVQNSCTPSTPAYPSRTTRPIGPALGRRTMSHNSRLRSSDSTTPRPWGWPRTPWNPTPLRANARPSVAVSRLTTTSPSPIPRIPCIHSRNEIPDPANAVVAASTPLVRAMPLSPAMTGSGLKSTPEIVSTPAARTAPKHDRGSRTRRTSSECAARAVALARTAQRTEAQASGSAKNSPFAAPISQLPARAPMRHPGPMIAAAGSAYSAAAVTAGGAKWNATRMPAARTPKAATFVSQVPLGVEGCLRAVRRW